MRVLMVPVVALLLWAGSQAGSKVPVGVVAGVIVDAMGSSLPGAAVELVSGSVVVTKTRTDTAGRFRFEGVKAGKYQVKVSISGFLTAIVPVTVGSTALQPLRVTLQVASIAEAVVVTSDAAKMMSRRTSVDAMAAAPAAVPFGIVAGDPWSRPRMNTEAYDRIDENGFRRTLDDPLSTFSIDVDTASYANVRRFVTTGMLPPEDAVRVEELINYFKFEYPQPKESDPFSVTTEVAPCPWNLKHKLALIGLQGRALESGKTPPRNLVFLLDVSGSMDEPDKLPLVQTAMRMLANTLTADDRVAIVVYAGARGLALPSTTGDRKSEITGAIAALTPGGSTNGAEGIKLAYDTAAKNFVKGGINRVILATDGDFNVGVTSEGELTRLIEHERERGIFLSVLGVGTGNLKDSTMEKLADRGNGNYAYLDTLHEAQRVLIAEAGATLVTIAKDVKIQVEFNPRTVGAYRLVGYENRLLAKEDFNDDKKDAGEIGAGHSVTALYEIVPPGEESSVPPVDDLKYQSNRAASGTAGGNTSELMTVKLRYKAPDGSTSKLMTVTVDNRAGELSANVGFAASVAEFGMLLRDSAHKGGTTWESARTLARRYRGDDPDGYRLEFSRLIDLAAAIAPANSVSRR